MSEVNTNNPKINKKPLINDLLMKPFSLGWTREVVKRVVTHNKTPNCDIYYFNPDKKRLRSLTEVKSHLTDGLSPECFSFKKEPLGLGPDLETIRNAQIRGKIVKKHKEREKASDQLRNTVKPNNSDKEAEMEKSEMEGSKPSVELIDEVVKPITDENKEKIEIKKNAKNDFESNSKRTKPDSAENKENNADVNSKKVTQAKGRSLKLKTSVEVQTVKARKTVLKKVMNAKKAKQAKQARVVSNKKVLKQIVKKKVASPNQKLSNTYKIKKAGLKSSKSKALNLKTEKKPIKTSPKKTKNEVTKVSEINHAEKSAVRDLKSIVKKNIGKYREMREKQKLGVGKSPIKNIVKKLGDTSVRRSRSEPISKNKLFYLKPLLKGWRRELVFRSSCTKAGQHADVYYFHPSGKKLRSSREIAENLTHGLSLECFTFRKEPIGCGEPSEVVRNARPHQKSLAN